jgi:hypothetical protein
MGIVAKKHVADNSELKTTKVIESPCQDTIICCSRHQPWDLGLI